MIYPPFVYALIIVFTMAPSMLSALPSRSQALENSYSLEQMEKLKDEVLDSFTLYGEPITPLAIKTFVNPLSDLAPSVMGLDLNATVNTNLYHGDITRNEEFVRVTTDSPTTNETLIDEYRVLRRLGDDMVVIAQRSYTLQFPGVWGNILVLKISVQPIYGEEGKRYVLLAEQKAYYGLPDRGRYEIHGMKIRTYLRDHVQDMEGKKGPELSVDLSVLLE